jgi:hypothetical protein
MVKSDGDQLNGGEMGSHQHMNGRRPGHLGVDANDTTWPATGSRCEATPATQKICPEDFFGIHRLGNRSSS